MSAPIQIVDEHDIPIGVASIPEALKKGLVHRIVRIMVENPSGEILLQKRSPEMRSWPNCWDNSAAGHVDAGEEYMPAAKRELFEEIGIKDHELTELGTYYTDVKYHNHIQKRFNRAYRVITGKTPTNLSLKEVAEVKWVSLQELREMIKNDPSHITDGLQDVVSRYY